MNLELLTRMSASFLGGILLTQAGVLIQFISRNPLASPSTLGIEGGVLILVLLLEIFFKSYYLKIGVLLVFSLVIPQYLSRKVLISDVDLTGQKIILWGLGFNLLIGASFSLIQFLFLAFNISFPQELWFGHFRYVSSMSVLILGGWSILSFLILYRLRNLFSLWVLGSEWAIHFKMNLRYFWKITLMVCFLSTAFVIGHYGSFAFIGLIFPHLLRPLFKKWSPLKEIFILPLLGGGLFLILDQICYWMTIMGAEIPVGMLASVLGSLILIFLIKSERRVFRSK